MRSQDLEEEGNELIPNEEQRSEVQDLACPEIYSKIKGFSMVNKEEKVQL